MNIRRSTISAAVGLGLAALAAPAFAGGSNLCADLPNWPQLKTALAKAVSAADGGLGFNMRGVLVATEPTGDPPYSANLPVVH
jgi:hypothetical protein